ncbi:hypothetical protein ACHWQZ_G009729 [Mnemiopsis leidyi]
MSFKDLRYFTEMMRALGYPRQISMENFRQPNFPLVAEILMWLVKRYEPNASLPHDIDTEDDRVIFIKYVSQFMATKTRIKLNPKKLYMADGYSVQEMLKVVTMLYNAVKSNKADHANEDVTERSFDVSNKISELKQARQLATEITMSGAKLYELLAVEVDLRELRLAAVARPLEMAQIEQGMKNKVVSIENEIKGTQNKLDNIANDEANLEAKIEKKKAELERNNKRLKSLQNVRPAFMDEFEKLEGDLKKLYEVYMEKFRNLTYLEQIVDAYDRQQQVKVEETEKQLRRMQEQLREEEKKLFNQTDTFENFADDSDGEVKDVKSRNPRIVGAMEASDSESEEGSDYISSGSELAGEGEMPISDDEEEETDSENYDDKDDSDDIDF